MTSPALRFAFALLLSYSPHSFALEVGYKARLRSIKVSSLVGRRWSPQASPHDGIFFWNATQAKPDWHAWQVPNPWTNPEKCNLPARGWLCDPDNILSSAGRQKILNVMGAIHQNVKVRCPNGQNYGYQPALAIVRKMAEPAYHTMIWEKHKTAETLTTEIGDRWGVGNSGCDNGLMLFISTDDSYSSIKTAATMNSTEAVNNTLTEDVARAIVSNMKSDLSRQDYDAALLLGVTQIYDALQGHAPSRSGKDVFGRMLLYILLGVFLCGPLVTMVFARFFMCLLMPCAWCLEGVACWKCTAVSKEESLEAEQDLQRVQSELGRDEFDQTLCPACLEPLAAVPACTELDCRHRFHKDCVRRCFDQGQGGCPMCSCDANIPLTREDQAKPYEYQRRLRAYLYFLRQRRPEMFNLGNSVNYGPYAQRPVQFYCGWAESLNSHYQGVMGGSRSIPEGVNSTGGSSNASGHGRDGFISGFLNSTGGSSNSCNSGRAGFISGGTGDSGW